MSILLGRTKYFCTKELCRGEISYNIQSSLKIYETYETSKIV